MERFPAPMAFDIKISKRRTSVNSGGAALRMVRTIVSCVSPSGAMKAMSLRLAGNCGTGFRRGNAFRPLVNCARSSSATTSGVLRR